MTTSTLVNLKWSVVSIWWFAAATVSAHGVLLPVEIEQDTSGEGVPEIHLRWPMEPGLRYGLYRSSDLRRWELAPGFPTEAATEHGNYTFVPAADRGFFRVARLGPSPEGFVLIPAGAYQRGDAHDDPQTYMEWSRPVREVEVSAFYSARTPVSYEEWLEVFSWALDRGYEFDRMGTRGWAPGIGQLPASAVGNRHPVVEITWHDAVKWCNARSEREGLTPVYYTDETHDTVYRSGQENLLSTHVDWAADGYRLPTETEWEKAARGGLIGKRWPWGDEPRDGFRANYAGSRTGRGTAPVGNFPANGYGLYDLSGNVAEWCWDWLEIGWYQQEASGLPDTRGPDEGIVRVHRGGTWANVPEFCRVAFRTGTAHTYWAKSIGFRPVRSAP